MNQTHGVPEVQYWTADSTGGQIPLIKPSIYLQISPSAGKVRIYFKQEDFDGDAGANPLTGIGEPVLELDGATGEMFQGPVHARNIWARGVGGDASFTIIAYAKKA